MNYENKHVKIQMNLIRTFEKMIDCAPYLDCQKAYYIFHMVSMCSKSIDADFNNKLISEIDRNGLYIEIMKIINLYICEC